jgi:aldehyde:ferredoxin oxidoreductase
MSIIPGYHGRYLRVDLGRQSWSIVPIARDVLRSYIGGTGLGTWILLRETPVAPRASAQSDAPAAHALTPEMPLVWVFSPLVGTPLTTSAKFGVLAKSPLTHRINDALSSSHFAIVGKKTGYDAIVVVGRAERPTALFIRDDDVRFLPADDLAGTSAAVAADRLRAQHGRAWQVAAIGPAGEAGLPIATISHDGRHAGRGGLGGVMGSKQLKAVAVQGSRLTPVAQPQALVEYSRKLSVASFGPATAKYRELGTVSNLLVFNRLGSLPTRNFQSGEFDGAERLAPESAPHLHPRTRTSCAACTIGCEHIFHRDTGDSAGVRLEYESLFALGSLCGVSDTSAVLAAAAYCDEAGIDTISAGGAVAFGMECAERGLLHEPSLRFGSANALLTTLQQMVERRGVGELLALGVREAARRIGSPAEQFAMHVKGLELPGYDPRALQTMALGFAVGTRGADHNRSGAYQVDLSERVNRLAPDDSSVALAIESEDEATLMDSLILCKFLRGVFEDRIGAMAEMLRLVTGWDIDRDELVATASRIVTAKKQYNIHQDWTPAEDCLPDRCFDEPLAEGASAGASLSRARLADMVRLYNLARGWSPEGWPPPEPTNLNPIQTADRLSADTPVTATTAR